MKDAIFLKGASALDCIFHWTVGLGGGGGGGGVWPLT